MPNNTLTHKMIAREAAAILEEEAPFLANVNKARQDEFGEAVSGYKKGDYVDIGIESGGRVFNGATFAEGGSATDNKEQSVRLQLDTQKHIGIKFGAKEQKLDITDFRERILRPQMRVLSAAVEADLIQKAIYATPNLVGSVGNLPTAMKTYSEARAKMEQFLARPGDRYNLFSSDANVELVDASKALFHAGKEVERGFIEGYVGMAQGAKFYEHQSLGFMDTGTQATGFAVNGTIAEGATSLAVKSVTNGATLKKGQVFTIAGINAVHPLTGASLNKLQQFVVTADVTFTATTGTVSIYPAIAAAAPNKTVSAIPADGTVVTLVGAASKSYRQNLMFQKEAFTVAAAPLPVLAGCEGYTARLPNGLSVRVMTGGDFVNDLENTRIDILYGFAAPRPLWACRITE